MEKQAAEKALARAQEEIANLQREAAIAAEEHAVAQEAASTLLTTRLDALKVLGACFPPPIVFSVLGVFYFAL